MSFNHYLVAIQNFENTYGKTYNTGTKGVSRIFVGKGVVIFYRGGGFTKDIFKHMKNVFIYIFVTCFWLSGGGGR